MLDEAERKIRTKHKTFGCSVKAGEKPMRERLNRQTVITLNKCVMYRSRKPITKYYFPYSFLLSGHRLLMMFFNCTTCKPCLCLRIGNNAKKWVLNITTKLNSYFILTSSLSIGTVLHLCYQHQQQIDNCTDKGRELYIRRVYKYIIQQK